MFKINDVVMCIDTADAGDELTRGVMYTVAEVDTYNRVRVLGGTRFYISHRFMCVVPVSTATSPSADSWDYAVADALRKKALDAIDEYNAYVDKRPTTTYYKLHKGY